MVLVRKLIRIGLKPRLIFRTEIRMQEKKRMGLETIFPSPFMCGIGTKMILIYLKKSN
jgi:hypothetical protein